MQRRVLLCVVVIAMLAVFAGGLIACKQEKQTDFVVTSVEGVHDYDIDAEKMIISVVVDPGTSRFSLRDIVFDGEVTLSAFSDKDLKNELGSRVTLSDGKVSFWLKATSDADPDVYDVYSVIVTEYVPQSSDSDVSLKDWQYDYAVGERFSSGNTLDVSGETVKITEDMLEGFDTSKEGRFDITINYEDATVSTYIRVTDDKGATPELPYEPTDLDPASVQEHIADLITYFNEGVDFDSLGYASYFVEFYAESLGVSQEAFDGFFELLFGDAEPVLITIKALAYGDFYANDKESFSAFMDTFTNSEFVSGAIDLYEYIMNNVPAGGVSALLCNGFYPWAAYDSSLRALQPYTETTLEKLEQAFASQGLEFNMNENMLNLFINNDFTDIFAGSEYEELYEQLAADKEQLFPSVSEDDFDYFSEALMDTLRMISDDRDEYIRLADSVGGIVSDIMGIVQFGTDADISDFLQGSSDITINQAVKDINSLASMIKRYNAKFIGDERVRELISDALVLALRIISLGETNELNDICTVVYEYGDALAAAFDATLDFLSEITANDVQEILLCIDECMKSNVETEQNIAYARLTVTIAQIISPYMLSIEGDNRETLISFFDSIHLPAALAFEIAEEYADIDVDDLFDEELSEIWDKFSAYYENDVVNGPVIKPYAEYVLYYDYDYNGYGDVISTDSTRADIVDYVMEKTYLVADLTSDEEADLYNSFDYDYDIPASGESFEITVSSSKLNNDLVLRVYAFGDEIPANFSVAGYGFAVAMLGEKPQAVMSVNKYLPLFDMSTGYSVSIEVQSVLIDEVDTSAAGYYAAKATCSTAFGDIELPLVCMVIDPDAFTDAADEIYLQSSNVYVPTTPTFVDVDGTTHLGVVAQNGDIPFGSAQIMSGDLLCYIGLTADCFDIDTSDLGMQYGLLEIPGIGKFDISVEVKSAPQAVPGTINIHSFDSSITDPDDLQFTVSFSTENGGQFSEHGTVSQLNALLEPYDMRVEATFSDPDRFVMNTDYLFSAITVEVFVGDEVAMSKSVSTGLDLEGTFYFYLDFLGTTDRVLDRSDIADAESLFGALDEHILISSEFFGYNITLSEFIANAADMGYSVTDLFDFECRSIGVVADIEYYELMVYMVYGAYDTTVIAVKN